MASVPGEHHRARPVMLPAVSDEVAVGAFDDAGGDGPAVFECGVAPTRQPPQVNLLGALTHPGFTP